LGFREVLRQAGFAAEPVMLNPDTAYAHLTGKEPCLVFLDAECASTPETLDDVICGAPGSRFVLAGSEITPDMLLLAVEAGVHGVLSTRLPIEEAAQRVTRIWDGERQYRFDSAPAAPSVTPLAAGADFDADWMFGQVV
jgi:hypothetical protein